MTSQVAEPGAVDAAIESRLNALEERMSRLTPGQPQLAGNSFVAFSGELDKLLFALMLAIEAASLGTPATMFFTFWGWRRWGASEFSGASKRWSAL